MNEFFERLRGRIVCARSLCYGRFAGCALQVLNRTCSDLASRTSTSRCTLTDGLRMSLGFFVKVMTEAPMTLWRYLLANNSVLGFVDNDAAK